MDRQFRDQLINMKNLSCDDSYSQNQNETKPQWNNVFFPLKYKKI